MLEPDEQLVYEKLRKYCGFVVDSGLSEFIKENKLEMSLYKVSNILEQLVKADMAEKWQAPGQRRGWMYRAK